MKKTILVAGAGHGGLAAAALLAGNGYDVTVLERQERANLGHDWEDRFSFRLLSSLTGVPEEQFPEGSWRFRGDCAFVSPNKQTKVVVRYTDETRQRVMDRKAVVKLLLAAAEERGAKLRFGVEVTGPLIDNDRVAGLATSEGDCFADLVVDAAGVFSPVRMGLPESFGIEREPREGDLFYAYRAYFDRLPGFDTPDAPFEVYLRHEGEKGLSWFCTFDDCCDVLIGRTSPLTDEELETCLETFRKEHPWMGTRLLRGGQRAVIPVRRALTKFVADGYAAVGDAAFMTTPMNGMGLDLSLQAGGLLARTILWNRKKGFTAEGLWGYNRSFHRQFGGEAARNEGLKNALLAMDAAEVNFLFSSGVIAASDLSGAGRSTDLKTLLGKLRRGMKDPGAFFALLGGLSRGAKTAKLLKNAPLIYDAAVVDLWKSAIEAPEKRIEN